MGDVVHQAVIVTSWDRDAIYDAHSRAWEIFGRELVSSVTLGLVNGYASFAVLPCGSKEGWPEGNQHDARCRAFVEALKKIEFVDFVAVKWGDQRDPEIPESQP